MLNQCIGYKGLSFQSFYSPNKASSYSIHASLSFGPFQKKNHEKLRCKATAKLLHIFSLKQVSHGSATTYFFAETSITRFSFHSIVIQIFVRFLNCMKQFLIIDFMQKSMVHGIQPGIKFQKGIKMSNGDIKT